jgi:hypothetical protein
MNFDIEEGDDEKAEEFGSYNIGRDEYIEFQSNELIDVHKKLSFKYNIINLGDKIFSYLMEMKPQLKQSVLNAIKLSLYFNRTIINNTTFYYIESENKMQFSPNHKIN